MYVCQKSVEKRLGTLKQRDFKLKLETKNMIKVMLDLNLFIHLYFITIVVCKSLHQINPTTHILDHTYPEFIVRLLANPVHSSFANESLNQTKHSLQAGSVF